MTLDYEADFNAVVGLTEYRDAILHLRPRVEEWGMEQLGYVPELRVSNRGMKVVMLLCDQHDEVLFRLNFAQHYMPAAIHFVPFAD